nr:MAG TPA: hypothetical protein [Bacteriophage sp.]DAU54578.1 MAG TPA: hypothetical protein [Caudoviricetes sp.]
MIGQSTDERECCRKAEKNVWMAHAETLKVLSVGNQQPKEWIYKLDYYCFLASS